MRRVTKFLLLVAISGFLALNNFDTEPFRVAENDSTRNDDQNSRKHSMNEYRNSFKNKSARNIPENARSSEMQTFSEDDPNEEVEWFDQGLFEFEASLKPKASGDSADAESAAETKTDPSTDDTDTTPDPSTDDPDTTPDPTSTNDADTTPDPSTGNTVSTPDTSTGNTVTSPDPSTGNTVSTQDTSTGNTVTSPDPSTGNTVSTQDTSTGNTVTSPDPSTLNTIPTTDPEGSDNPPGPTSPSIYSTQVPFTDDSITTADSLIGTTTDQTSVNPYGTSESEQSSQITLPSTSTTKKPVSKKCPKIQLEDLGDGYFFPESDPGKMIVKECPSGMQGSAEWFCQKSGDWEGDLPNLSGCTSINFQGVLDDLQDTDNVANVIDEVTSMIENSQGGLAPGDLEGLSTFFELSGSRQENLLQSAQSDEEKSTISRKYLESLSSLVGASLKNPVKLQSAEYNLRSRAGNQILIQLESASASLLQYLRFGEEVKHSEVSHDLVLKNLPRDGAFFKLDQTETSFSNGNASIQIMSDWILDNLENTEKSIKISFLGFKDMQKLLKPNEKSADGRLQSLNTLVMGAQLATSGKKQSSMISRDAVKMSFKVIQPFIAKDEEDSINCVFWDTTEAAWSSSGCQTIVVDDENVDCSCSHLTNFAVGINLVRLQPEHKTLRTWWLIAGNALSMYTLVMSGAAYIFVKTLGGNIWTKVVNVNLCLTLLTAQGLMLGIDEVATEKRCLALAVLLHYFQMTSGAWLLIKSFNLLSFKKSPERRKLSPTKKKLLALGAYAVPAVYVGIVFAASLGKAYSSKSLCWLEDEHTMTFAIPIELIAVIAFLMSMSTLLFAQMDMKQSRRFLRKAQENTRANGQDYGAVRNMKFLRIHAASLAIFTLILGLSWALTTSYTLFPSRGTEISSAIGNALQGMFMLLIVLFRLEAVPSEVESNLAQAVNPAHVPRISEGRISVNLPRLRPISPTGYYRMS